MWKRWQKHQMGIAKELRAFRWEKGVPIKELAHKIGYHPVTVSRWETGHNRPSVLALEAWANALGVELTIREQKSRT